MQHEICVSCETVKHCSQHGCIPKQPLKPCRSPYCECTPGTCSHPGCYDARSEPFKHLAPVQEPVAGKGKELSERLKLCARNVAFVAAGRVDMSSAAMQEMFALIDHVCAGLDSPPEAPVQEPVSVILSQWKSGAIGATEAILELFKHYSSNPSISATQQTAQQAVPEGYALIGIDALKAWGKYDLVKSMCMFPVDPPAAHRQQKPAAEITGVDECGPMLGWHKHWINFPIGTKFYTSLPAAPVEKPAARKENYSDDTRYGTGGSYAQGGCYGPAAFTDGDHDGY